MTEEEQAFHEALIERRRLRSAPTSPLMKFAAGVFFTLFALGFAIQFVEWLLRP